MHDNECYAERRENGECLHEYTLRKQREGDPHYQLGIEED